MHIPRITKQSKTSFPRTETYRFTNNEKTKSSFTFHAKQKCPFTRHEKSIGDPRPTDLPPASWYSKPSYVYLNIYLTLFVCTGPEKPDGESPIRIHTYTSEWRGVSVTAVGHIPLRRKKWGKNNDQVSRRLKSIFILYTKWMRTSS